MAHPTIKKFAVEGELIDDSYIPSKRTEFESFLLKDIRDRGYIPVLDLDTVFSTTYNAEADRWFFLLTMYAVYVGRNRSCHIEGISGNKMIPRSIQKSKSVTSSKQ